MRRMDTPFEALDLFSDSTMHRLLSYETMLNCVLTGSEEGDVKAGSPGSWRHGHLWAAASLCSATTYRMVQGTQSRVTRRYCHPQTLSSEEDKVNTENLLLFMDGCRSLIDYIEAHTNGLLLVTIVCTDAWSC
jgi:hypothetical protein